DSTKTFSTIGQTKQLTASTTSQDASLQSLYTGTHSSVLDTHGRTVRMTSESLLVPDTLRSLFVNTRKWLRTNYSIQRDELGRIDGYGIETESREDATGSPWASTNVTSNVGFWYGPNNELGARLDRTLSPVPGTTTRRRDFDAHLFLYDGRELVAEVARHL